MPPGPLRKATLLLRKRRRLLAVILLPGLGFAAFWWLLPWTLTLPDDLLNGPRPGIQWLDRDGGLLRHPLTDDVRRGTATDPTSIPPRIKAAILIAEDRRFDSHGGIDTVALARATRDAIRQRRVVSGASTITQQLAKLASPPAPRNAPTKLREMLLARRLEMTWTKDRILAAYLDRLPFGNLMQGIDAGAQGYFGKAPADLSWAEAALLATLPQAPSRLNPWRHPQSAIERQQAILHRLRQHDLIDDPTLARALAEPLDLYPMRSGFAAPHAIDWLQLNLRGTTSCGPVRTTIDRQLQTRTERLIQATLRPLAPRRVNHAAVVVIENRTRHVLALAGSIDYRATDGQLNGAWLPHPAGSTLKPFTYALALERGTSPAAIVPDLPVRFTTSTGIYEPQNYHRRHHGPVTHAFALANSLNVPAVRVLENCGGPAALLTLLHDLGLGSLDQPADHYGLGLTLGNGPVRLVELTNAFATLANLGRHQPWSLLLDSPESTTSQPIRPDTAYTLAATLSDPLLRSPAFGSSNHLTPPFRTAVKTGTSSDYRDNWIIGFTRDHTVGVWVGNFDRLPMQQVSGVTGAAPLFHAVMLALSEVHPPAWLTPPDSVAEVEIDPRTGHRQPLSGDWSPSMLHRLTVPLRSLPPIAQPHDYDPQGRAWLDPSYAAWAASPENWLGHSVRVIEETSAPLARSVQTRITEPDNGTILILDPDLPGGGRLLHLRHNGGNRPDLSWQSPTLRLQAHSAHGTTSAALIPGHHEILLLQDDDSTIDRVSIEVRDAR